MIKQRGVGMSILFSFLTCGIYGLFWMAFISDDMSEYLGEEKSGGTEVLLSIITCGLYMIYWNYKMGKKLYTVQERAGITASDNSILYLILGIFLSYVPMWIIQSDFNKVLEN